MSKAKKPGLQGRIFALSRRFPLLRRMLPTGLKRRIFDRLYSKPPQRMPYVPQAYPHGVNLFGFFSAPLGLGQGVRLYREALAGTGIPYQAIDTGYLLPEGNGETPRESLPYGINVVHLNPDVLPLLFQTTPRDYWNRRYTVGVLLWELERMPKQWVQMLPAFDEFWVPSHFIEHALLPDTDRPVRYLPYGIEARPEPGLSREDFRLPWDAFLLLCMYDAHSYTSRKNPAGAVAAFMEAFPTEQDVRLVLKTQNASPAELDTIQEATQQDARIIVFNERMEKGRVNTLIACCDALISMHRSEGFGLVLAEAMRMGVPVVATAWSSNTDFMDESCACMVQYTLVSTKGEYLGKQRGLRWAEPNVPDAAAHLRRLYQDSAYRLAIGQAGKARIEKEFSIERCAERMISYVDQISKKTEYGTESNRGKR